MKKLRQIVTEIKFGTYTSTSELNDMLWQFICYSPKMPVRLQQEQLLNEAEKFALSVKDEYFAKKELLFNGFKWGSGSKKILITHGWGSKAADFFDIIIALKEIGNVEIIAFDAPGNGSSEGELTNLLLYVESVKAIVLKYGKPDILIGHSLGAMANIIALNQLETTPSLLISIAPLIKLKENFENSMYSIAISEQAQGMFLKSFEEKFKTPASAYTLNSWYTFNDQLQHWLAYDVNDQVSTYDYMDDFLKNYPLIKSQSYEGVGHERILKSAELVTDLVSISKAVV